MRRVCPSNLINVDVALAHSIIDQANMHIISNFIFSSSDSESTVSYVPQGNVHPLFREILASESEDSEDLKREVPAILVPETASEHGMGWQN